MAAVVPAAAAVPGQAVRRLRRRQQTRPTKFDSYLSACQGLQAVWAHFEPSGSRRKCVLVTNSWLRYVGSVTAVVMTSHCSPPGVAKRSQYSVMVVRSLYGT